MSLIPKPEEKGYWSSESGITIRLEMLSHNITWGYFNNAVKVSASTFGIKYLKFVGPVVGACPYCEPRVGRTYRLGQFMPDLPAHPWCRHWWDLFFPSGDISDLLPQFFELDDLINSICSDCHSYEEKDLKQERIII